MTPVIFGLLGALVLQSVVNAWIFTHLLTHNRQLTSAMLQANGKADAARRLSPAQSEAKARTEVEMHREVMANSDAEPFTPQNPFGVSKMPFG